MYKAAFLFSFLLFAYFGTTRASVCAKLKVYTTKLQPECDAADTKIDWPNYEDQSHYIKCTAPGTAVLMKCPEGQLFGYVFQRCKSCEDYLPPVECPKLPTKNKPNCVPIENNGGGSTVAPTTTTTGTTKGPSLPTPHYPTDGTTSTVSSGTTAVTEEPIVTDVPEVTDAPIVTDVPEVTDDVTEPEVIETTENSGSTDFPGPPTPPSTNTDVPQPETEPPQPPVVEGTPPSVGS